MVFASRRTSIVDDDAISCIIEDDEYRKLQDDEPPDVGDLVFYHFDGILAHVAVVMSISKLTDHLGETISEQGATHVLSKWNDAFGEDVHEVGHHAWHGLDASWEFWTDRP